MVTRRRAILALGASAVSPFVSFAQSRKLWRIGFLLENEQPLSKTNIDAFKAGMSALGYAEGRDYAIDTRNAQSELARLAGLAAELVALKVDVIIPNGTPSAVAASHATREIPILLTTIGDPVGSGLVASLAHPRGNVTGLTSINTELIGKRLDLLCQLMPRMRGAGFLYDPNNRNDALGLTRFESTCGQLRLRSIRAPVRNAEEIASAFVTLAHENAQGLIVSVANTNNASRERIIQYAEKYRLPAAYGRSDFSEAGGLLSYSADFTDLWRRAATYADKIFKGAKPGDLPIQQPNKFEFVVNMRTAKALGIEIPESMLVRATKVIE